MNTGPLRRLVGTAGLVALTPTAVMLLTGGITPFDAAVRALATLAGTMVIGRVASFWLTSIASSFERQADPDAPEETTPQFARRRKDRPGDSGAKGRSAA